MKQAHAKGRGAGKATGKRAHRKVTNGPESASDTGAGTPQSKAATTKTTRNSTAARVSSGTKTSTERTKRAGGPQSKSAPLSPKAIINEVHKETGAKVDLLTKVCQAFGRIMAQQLGPNGSGIFTFPETGLRVKRIPKPGAERQWVLMGVPLKRLIEATGTVRTSLPA